MPYVRMANVASIVGLGGLLLFFLVLVIRKIKLQGSPEPLKNLTWFSQIFKQGIRMIRTCPWILVLPFLGHILKTLETLPSVIKYIREHPEPIRGPMEFSIGFFVRFLKYNPHTIFSSFIRALGQINTALFNQFYSILVIGITLLLVMFIVLRQTPLLPVDSANKSNNKGRMFLAIVSGVLGVAILIFYMMDRRYEVEGELPFLLYFIVLGLLAIIVNALASTTVLLMMQAAVKKERLGFMEAVSKLNTCIRPMLIFFLIISGIGFLAHLSLWTQTLIKGSQTMAGLSWSTTMTKNFLHSMLLVMVAFVPVIIVTGEHSIFSSLERSAELWARHTKTVAVFVIISAFLLCIPSFIDFARSLVAPFMSWTGQAATFLTSSLKVVIAVIVMNSMFVLYKTLQNPAMQAQPIESQVETTAKGNS